MLLYASVIFIFALYESNFYIAYTKLPRILKFAPFYEGTSADSSEATYLSINSWRWNTVHYSFTNVYILRYFDGQSIFFFILMKSQ